MVLSGLSRTLTGYFVFILITTTIGPLLFGFHLAELNAPQDVLTCHSKSLEDASFTSGLPQCIPMTPAEIGLVGSIYTVGGFLGALGGGPTSSKVGRLRTMQFTTIFFMLGPLFETFAASITILATGRFISGLGAGAAMVVAPIYIAEISPLEERGLFGAFTQVMVNVGIVIAQLLGLFLSHGQYWRLILASGGVIGGAQLIMLCLGVCESPRFSATQGSLAKATRDLQRIRGADAQIQDEVREWGLKSPSTQQDGDDEHQTLLTDTSSQPASLINSPNSDGGRKEPQTLNMWQVLHHDQSRSAVVAVVAVMLTQQLTGINSVVMYGVHLLASVLASNSAILNLVVSTLNILMTALAAPLIDRLGRKTCLLMSIGGMGTSSLLLAVGIDKHISVLSAVSVALFVGSFGLGLGPVPFILSSELVGPEAVGATQSWALGTNWMATFLVAQFFPVVNDWLGGGKVYYIFMAIAVFFFGFISWFVPETKGKANADEVWGHSRRED